MKEYKPISIVYISPVNCPSHSDKIGALAGSGNQMYNAYSLLAAICFFEKTIFCSMKYEIPVHTRGTIQSPRNMVKMKR
jgi:hypothetical protein